MKHEDMMYYEGLRTGIYNTLIYLEDNGYIDEDGFWGLYHRIVSIEMAEVEE